MGQESRVVVEEEGKWKQSSFWEDWLWVVDTEDKVRIEGKDRCNLLE